jgi:hypothetical protein
MERAWQRGEGILAEHFQTIAIEQGRIGQRVPCNYREAGAQSTATRRAVKNRRVR